MSVTVSELPNRWAESEDTWIELAGTNQSEQSDWVLLPEMPFYRWLAGATQATPGLWAVTAHDGWTAPIAELSAPISWYAAHHQW